MLQRLYTLFIAITICSSIHAQTIEEIKRDRSTYIYGEGKGFLEKEADKEALAAIISQISISINEDTKYEVNETDMKVTEKLNSVINTSSNAMLVNIEKIVIANEPDAHVMRYIRREDVNRVFDGRKLKINDMIANARASLSERKINDAIRNFYWAHVLIQSLLYPNEVYIYDNDSVKQVANVWIPGQIDKILDDIRFDFNRVSDENTLFMDVFYKNEPIRSIDYNCFDGSSWGSIYSGVDGKGVVELRQNSDVEKLRIRIEYMFEDESVRDPEVNKILAISQEIPYKKAYKYISTDGSDTPKQSTSPLASKQTNTSKVQAIPNLTHVVEEQAYQQVVKEVVASIASKNRTDDIRHYFTEAGYNDYLSLIKFGSAKIVDANTPLYYALGDEVYCRNILMNFSFEKNRQFMENVVFQFDKEKRISHVTFGLEREASDDVLSKEQWPEAARIILVHFLENYKTAYALKQIGYIESIFAEDALIITGSLVRSATAAEMNQMTKQYVHYTTHSKGEYIRKLRNIFKANEYVNIQFADNDIIRAGEGGEVYGIQIRQNYFSTHYGDTGYLFLMVDLNDMDKPVIHVRTWQPEKDPKFGLYDLGTF